MSYIQESMKEKLEAFFERHHRQFPEAKDLVEAAWAQYPVYFNGLFAAADMEAEEEVWELARIHYPYSGDTFNFGAE